jgi:hypothetical protein
MLYVLKNEHLLGLIYLHYAVEFSFVVVFVGVEIGSECDFIEEEVHRQRSHWLLSHVLLKESFQEGPEDYLLDDAVDSPCFLLVFEEAHLTSIHAQSQLRRVHHSDPTEIITLQVILCNQVYTLLPLYCKVQRLSRRSILIVIKIEIEHRFEGFFLVLYFGDED